MLTFQPGSGLGSSSSFTVGLLNAIFALQNKMIAKRDLALKAIHVEQDLIGETVGSQDQTAAAFGGLNLIRFGGQRNIEVDPVVLPGRKLYDFQEHLLLCFTGFARTASDIAEAQVDNIKNKAADLRLMMELANHSVEILTDDKIQIEDFGKLLNEQWQIKRGLSDVITTPEIDSIYQAGIEAGAIGGKLLGQEVVVLCSFLQSLKIMRKLKINLAKNDLSPSVLTSLVLKLFIFLKKSISKN